MDYALLSGLYRKLEGESSQLKMQEHICNFLKGVDCEDINEIVLLLLGRVFPSWSPKEVGVASSLMVKAISKSTGVSERAIVQYWKETGDLGISAEKAFRNKRQAYLLQKKLDTRDIIKNLRKAANLEGSGTVDRKIDIVSGLLASSPLEGVRYIVRIILGELRMGVGDGIIKKSLADTYSTGQDKIEMAFSIMNDYGEIARKLCSGESIEKKSLTLGRPIRVMLAQKAGSIAQGFERVGKPAAIEYKYDGMRVQIHKWDGQIRVFTRRLDDVTRQFPELVEAVRENVSADNFVVEGEAIGFEPKTGEYVPFQAISRRIKRKYGIPEMASQIPVELFLFDMTYCNSRMLLPEPFKKRRKMLEKIVKQKKGQIMLSTQIVTSDEGEAEDFYRDALSKKQEGVMFKNLEANYKPGSRVGYMVKLKPDTETLDLVIVGAEWGKGKRATWLSSFLLSCRGENGFLTVGKMATGLTEAQFSEMTERLKPIIVSEDGRNVAVKPELVVEVGYQEIQKSPTYESGFALRFPRLVRCREDKSAEEADTIETIKNLSGK